MINRKDDILWNAVSSGNLKEVQRAVAAGGDVNMTCGDSFVRKEVAAKSGADTGKSLLHHAAWIGSLPIFKYLVLCGADSNRRRYTAGRPHGGVNGRGPTPFHFAVQYNRMDIVKYLIDIGVDINSAGEQGYTALHIATKFNYPGIVRLLLECGARTDMITKDEKTARDLASGTQERSHTQMGDMEKLFDEYDAEIRSRARPVPLAPLAEWQPRARRNGAPAETKGSSRRPLTPIENNNNIKYAYESYEEKCSFCHKDADWPRRFSQRSYDHNSDSGADHYLERTDRSNRNKYDHASFYDKDIEPKGNKSAYHGNFANGSQNNGNIIGDKSTVRQSKLFRMYESGNEVKSILGQDCLRWDVTKKQGAYEGRVFDYGKTSGHGYYSSEETAGSPRNQYSSSVASGRTIPSLPALPPVSTINNNTAKLRKAKKQAEEKEYSRWTTTSRQSYA